MRTFVYNQLSQTYGLEAESIIKSLNEKLTTMEENTSDSFQILLQTIAYPLPLHCGHTEICGEERERSDTICEDSLEPLHLIHDMT